ncbi:sulfur carrier protein ThiS [Salinarchaeum sp. Harcht-Bsk1]|uniref:ubiquitin-like small modifier protein 1 n=1 Tax=Salinarchaeum sp. Harcht-Bsk1 TaxID=1333523 RepID=UPI0003423D4B|nr:ubiquitin-like small modifier protein 1 [Salinarchaeum sp. Harcht-Bsk1]AGN00799.1 sulfur carrier protein ThiS [Salinarchaeum sp. Harcht-Bsk1]
MEVTVYGQLRAVTGQKQVDVDADGRTVRDVLDAFVAAYPRAEPHLFRDDETPHPSVRVAVDGTIVELGDACPADASLSIHPAMQGG